MPIVPTRRFGASVWISLPDLHCSKFLRLNLQMILQTTILDRRKSAVSDYQFVSNIHFTILRFRPHHRSCILSRLAFEAVLDLQISSNQHPVNAYICTSYMISSSSWTKTKSTFDSYCNFLYLTTASYVSVESELSAKHLQQQLQLVYVYTRRYTTRRKHQFDIKR